MQPGLPEPATHSCTKTRAGMNEYNLVIVVFTSYTSYFASQFHFHFSPFSHSAVGHGAQDSHALPPGPCSRLPRRFYESSSQPHHFLMDVLPPGRRWQGRHISGQSLMINLGPKSCWGPNLFLYILEPGVLVGW